MLLVLLIQTNVCKIFTLICGSQQYAQMHAVGAAQVMSFIVALCVTQMPVQVLPNCVRLPENHASKGTTFALAPATTQY